MNVCGGESSANIAIDVAMKNIWSGGSTERTGIDVPMNKVQFEEGAMRTGIDVVIKMVWGGRSGGNAGIVIVMEVWCREIIMDWIDAVMNIVLGTGCTADVEVTRTLRGLVIVDVVKVD